MFGKLKDKLKGFFSKEEENIEETPKKEKSKSSKPKPSKENKKTIQKPKTSDNSEKDNLEKEIPTEEKLKEESEKISDDKEIKDSKKDITKILSGNIGFESDDSEELKEQVEKIKEEDNSEKKKPSFLSKFTKGLSGTQTLEQKHIDEIFEPLELILLENNVALEVVDKIHQDLKKDLVGIEVKKNNLEETIKSSLKDSISSVLIEPPNIIEQIKSHTKIHPSYTIVFFGINGTGKTTSVAKLASKLKTSGISCVLVAADTFRAASIEQLELHANKIGVPIIKGQYGSDPTSVAFDGKKYAEKNKIQCVLVDTAGRMYTKENLVKQMEKLIRVIKPELKIFVGESITGNDAIEQVKTFNEALEIDGIILSKADVDEKGGTALSVSQITGKPIYFLGTGQEYKDLEDFKKDKILKNLGLED